MVVIPMREAPVWRVAKRRFSNREPVSAESGRCTRREPIVGGMDQKQKALRGGAAHQRLPVRTKGMLARSR